MLYVHFSIHVLQYLLILSTSEMLELKRHRTALVSANIVMQEKKALKKMKRRLANGQAARETSKLVALSSIWLGFGKYIFSQNYISARLSSKSKKVHLAAGRAQLQHGADQCQKGAGDRQLLC